MTRPLTHIYADRFGLHHFDGNAQDDEYSTH